jgi:endonuclease YncB( thermonuclease family)
MGTLRIHGVIDLVQFWPKGSSDADTTKIKLIVGKNSFEYKKDGATKFSKITVFNGAVSRGTVSKEVITTSKKTGLQTITVRLQGIDAPELHYKAAPLKKGSTVTDAKRKKFNEINEDRRQCFAETATFELARHLKQFANTSGIVNAVFETVVNEPAEAVDTYGRFVGNVTVGGNHDINTWLVENGWGHPAFYTSMSKAEIEIFLKAWTKGKKKKNRPGKSISKNANDFDMNLLYREPKAGVVIPFTPGEDKGKVLMPKIYRRQVSWLISKEAKVIAASATFKAYLKKKPDQLALLDDFLANGINSAKVFSLDEFISAENKVLKNPEEFVFKEKAGTLVDASGKKIEKWK